jgi:hypothetical protein
MVIESTIFDKKARSITGNGGSVINFMKGDAHDTYETDDS